MIRFIVEILVIGLVVFLAANFVPGVSVNGYGTAILAAILIGLANATLGLFLRILTLPLNFLTLGLMSFVISVLMILLVSNILKGFEVSGFFAAALFAIVIAILKAIMGSFFRRS